MLSAARYQDAPGVQRPRRIQHSLDTYPEPSEHLRLQSTSQQQRSFAQNSTFNFDFRLESNALGTAKSTDQAASRNEESLDFSLAVFPEPLRNNYCEHPYAPAPLQIPSQSHSATHSPPMYLHSTTSTFTSQCFPDYPFHSDSHSLSPSPLERTTWTDNSSSLSLSPLDSSKNGPSDLGVDSRLTHIPFSIGLQSSQPSLHLSVLSESRLLDPQLGTAYAQGSPDSGSSDTPDGARSRIGPNGLAEDQPPTAQGKMRTRVYVACLQCRSRKIRCDGGKPKCLKCSRRSSECQYDAAPKRRGPDKKPGARQRTSKKAKVAVDAPIKDGGAQPAPWTPIAKSSEADDGGGRDAKRRRKASNADLPWSAGNGKMDSGRLSTTTATSVGVPSPVSSRNAQGLPVAFGSLTVVPDGVRDEEKPEHHLFHGLVGSRSHPQLTAQDRLNLSLDLSPTTTTENGTVRIREMPQVIHHRPPPYINPTPSVGGSYFPHAHIQVIDENEQQGDQNDKREGSEIRSEPSLEFSRKTWWDSLLAMYSPGTERGKTALEIQSDLQFLFKSSNYFLSFFNIPLFFSTFCNPVEREQMQPSIVLAGLALATFMRSSEINLGNAGRMRALWLRDAAQSALEASFNSQWIEPTLAQAAFLLALFEVCAHPQHSTERCNSSMLLLDSLIHALGLTMLDAGDPNVSVFSPRAVPAIKASHTVRQEGCSCNLLTLGQNSRSSQTHTPLWAATAAWNSEWTVSEIRRDETRRLCWSALHLTTGHTVHASAFALPMLNFYSVQPVNYALLFPGELLMQAPPFRVPHSSKETVWALYSRAMLLWNSCLRMREDDTTDDERATFAVGAWLESTAIEEALDAHTCGCDQAFMYQGREFLFITRMCITYEFSRFVPHPESDVNALFNRNKAMAWLKRQSRVAKSIMHGLHTVTGHKNNVLAQRPFFVWWFMSLVARSLMLFSMDSSLLIALEVCRAFLPPIEYLSCLWPCPSQRERYRVLHARLTQACQVAGVQPPSPPSFNTLSPGSPPINVI